ncbi:MAG TPA: thioredoxin family protein [Polyangiales bacterium]|nr:thioredoxin family protein [Polyangiales bacterium]
MATTYPPTSPTRAELDQSQGPLLVEFGATWCGICQALQPVIVKALREHPELPHIKVGDGRGQPLGRTFGIKLWPTLIALRDGREVARLVRPTSHGPILSMLASLDAQSR